MNFISNILAPTDYSECMLYPNLQDTGFHAGFRKGVSKFKDSLTAKKNQLEVFWNVMGENEIETDYEYDLHKRY